MPIVDVQLVAGDSFAPEGMASRLAEALAEVLSAPPGRVWVRLSVLSSALYSENGAQGGAAALPAFVRVLHADLPSPEAMAAQAQAISKAVAACIHGSSHLVHVEYAPAGRGRIALGGQLLR
jgi:phenylpyruvate tautomerase PptA (4-oxalocrotonate tautomerase family)